MYQLLVPKYFWLFLEELAEGETQARLWQNGDFHLTGFQTHMAFPAPWQKVTTLGVSMATRAPFPIHYAQFARKGILLFSFSSKSVLKSSTFLPGSHGSGTSFHTIAIPTPRMGRSQPACPQGPAQGRGDIPGDVPTGFCCRTTHHGLHGACCHALCLSFPICEIQVFGLPSLGRS